MDGASAIAGLIGLAALTGQSAVKVKRFINEYKDASKRQEDAQKWLSQIHAILADIEKSSVEVQGHGLRDLEISIANLKDSLQQCNEKIACFEADFAKSSGQKRLGKLKTVLSATEREGKRQDVDRAMDGVSRCCENLFRQLDLQGFPLLQKTSKQIESIASDVALLSTTTQTLFADNETLREQLHSHASALSGDLGEINLRLDKADQVNNIAATRLNGMEHDIANIYGMAAILPQEMQSIIAQTVSQSVATAFASLQQNTQQTPPRGRILHRKIVPTRLGAIRIPQHDFEDSESGKDRQHDLESCTHPYTLNQSQKLGHWKGRMLFCEVTVTMRKSRRTNIFRDFEIDKSCFEIDILTQSKSWPMIGQVHTRIIFGRGPGLSAIPQIKLTPSRYLFEDNPLAQAIKMGDIERVRIGLASNELCPLDIIADVPRRQSIKSNLGLIEYAANYQQLDIIQLLILQGAQLDVTQSSLTASMETVAFSNVKSDKYVMRTHVDINRELLKAGSNVDAIWVTDFYLFTRTWRGANLDVLFPQCEEYWEDIFKLLWGPFESSHHLDGLTDDDGRSLSAIDEFLYNSYVLQRNEDCDDPWAFRRLELALKFGARIDTPSPYGNLSIQNFIARVSARFRHPGMGRWMEDLRTEHEGRNIFHSLLWLLHSGADPVAVDEHGQTATWLAFYCQLLPEWFTALETHSISTEYVARHAISVVTQGFLDGLGSVSRIPYSYEAIPLNGPRELRPFNLWEDFDIHTVNEARALMRQEFAEHGHKVVIAEDTPREYGLLTTGVEFDLPSAPKVDEQYTVRKRLQWAS